MSVPVVYLDKAQIAKVAELRACIRAFTEEEQRLDNQLRQARNALYNILHQAALGHHEGYRKQQELEETRAEKPFYRLDLSEDGRLVVINKNR